MALDLTAYGITLNQARVYLYLVAEGISSAKPISESLGIHRVDVYRSLRELEGMGLLRTYLDTPKRFGALSPRNAIPVLLKRQEQTLVAFRRESKDLIARLNQLSTTLKRRAGQNAPARDRGEVYRLVLGEAQYIEEIRRVVRSARHEILRIVSSTGINRIFLTDVIKEYVEARSRGVSIRMISTINSENQSYASHLAKIIELRHLEGIHIRFTLVDHSIAILGARFSEGTETVDSQQNAYLVFNDPVYSEALGFLFENSWKISSVWAQ